MQTSAPVYPAEPHMVFAPASGSDSGRHFTISYTMYIWLIPHSLSLSRNLSCMTSNMKQLLLLLLIIAL